MKSKLKTLSELFFEEIDRRIGSCGYETSAIAAIYRSVFLIMPDHDLNLVLENVYRDRRKSGWYGAFHKSIRQCDFFQNCIRRDESIKLEADQQKELDQLDAELRNHYKLMDEFEPELKKSIPAHDHPDYVQKQAEYEVAYRKRSKELFPQEKHTRRFHLKSKLKSEQEKSICGHLDMILWNAIHADKDDFLRNTLKHTFEDYLEQKQIARKKKMAKANAK